MRESVRARCPLINAQTMWNALNETKFMSSPFDPSPNIDCPQCHGEGYFCVANGEVACGKLSLCADLLTLQRSWLSYSLGKWRISKWSMSLSKAAGSNSAFNRCSIPARHGEDLFANFQHRNKCDDRFVDHQQLDSALWFTGRAWVDLFSGRSRSWQDTPARRYLQTAGGRGRKSVRFVAFSRLLSICSGRATAKVNRPLRVLEPLIEVDILAIDELGKGRSTDWEMQVIDEIVSRRYNSMKSIIGTTTTFGEQHRVHLLPISPSAPLIRHWQTALEYALSHACRRCATATSLRATTFAPSADNGCILWFRSSSLLGNLVSCGSFVDFLVGDGVGKDKLTRLLGFFSELIFLRPVTVGLTSGRSVLRSGGRAADFFLFSFIWRCNIQAFVPHLFCLATASPRARGVKFHRQRECIIGSLPVFLLRKCCPCSSITAAICAA